MEKKRQSGESSNAGPSGVDTTAAPNSVTKVNPTQTSLLAVPPEIRVMVYDLLLVNRTMIATKPQWATHYPNQEGVVSGLEQGIPLTIEPTILRTCKQINREASAILYSRNVFNHVGLSYMSRFSPQVTTAVSPNIKLIKSLSLLIDEDDEVEPWLEILNVLATEAQDLRDFRILMFADRETSGTEEWYSLGLGDNVQFVRALTKIRGLDKLTIEGYYASSWLGYLKEMNTTIVAHQGFSNDTRQGDGKIKPNSEVHEHDYTQEELETFESYQLAIEDVMP